MTVFKRIRVIISSLISIALSVFFAMNPERGCYLVVGLLGVALLIYGFQQINYYFSMARYKVGGNTTLYISIICLNLATISLEMTDVRQQLVMVYLLAYYVFYGAIRIYSAVEAKKMGASSWRMRLIGGIACLVISVLCIFNFSSVNMMVYILTFGFISSAIMQIISACRRTAVIYIP